MKPFLFLARFFARLAGVSLQDPGEAQALKEILQITENDLIGTRASLRLLQKAAAEDMPLPWFRITVYPEHNDATPQEYLACQPLQNWINSRTLYARKPR